MYVLMNQQLSTDLVYAILKTITERTDGEVKKKYKPYDFSNQNRFLIESMVVRDPEAFQVAKIEKENTRNRTWVVFPSMGNIGGENYRWKQLVPAGRAGTPKIQDFRGSKSFFFPAAPSAPRKPDNY